MLTLLTIAAGLALLAGGGELLVRGSARLAAHLGVSSLVIGLTVVAVGTSAPELAVSLQSLRSGAADLAVGNVVGSNIFNVLLILGVSALIVPLTVSRRVVWVEVPVVIAISAAAWFAARDGNVTAVEGGLLLLAALLYTGWLLRSSRSEPEERVDEHEAARRSGAAAPAVMAVVGLGLLVLGARWLVAGAVTLATTLGVSDAVIGLTIVAAGTSLPEVAASIAAAAGGHRDMAVGNVLGSNIFNLTLILGSTAMAGGGLAVPEGVVTFDLVVMVAVAVACLPIFVTGHAIARWEGGLFLAYYVAYTLYLVLDATGHERLPHLRDAMLYFAIPLTTVTLVVLAARSMVATRREARRGTAR